MHSLHRPVSLPTSVGHLYVLQTTAGDASGGAATSAAIPAARGGGANAAYQLMNGHSSRFVMSMASDAPNPEATPAEVQAVINGSATPGRLDAGAGRHQQPVIGHTNWFVNAVPAVLMMFDADNPQATPAEVQAAINGAATPGRLDAGALRPGTPNRMLYTRLPPTQVRILSLSMHSIPLPHSWLPD